MLGIPACTAGLSVAAPHDKLEAVTNVLHTHRQELIEQRNSQFFDEEVSKLDLWSEDLKAGLEIEIKDIDKEIREQKKESTKVTDVKDKLEKQKELRKLEQKRKTMRQRLYEEQDKIDVQRDEMIARVEQQLASKVDVQEIFTIRWQLSAKDEG
jgi:adenine-specific DNA-methyltransferase